MKTNEPEIIYEDQHLLVIDKPAGMVVNRAETGKGVFTLQDWAAKKFSIFNFPARPAGGQFSINNTGEFKKRAGIVHRLDKDTSGVLLIAKTEEAFVNLQQQFKERTVKKKYTALVHGIVTPAEGTISAPIERSPFNPKKFGVFLGGREAVTEYKTVFSFQFSVFNYSLLEIYPQTGRTHQIRVHLRHVGHPIVSDILYEGRKNLKNDLKFCPRMFLHAKSIEFRHPVTGRTVRVESDLPEELKEILKKFFNFQFLTR